MTEDEHTRKLLEDEVIKLRAENLFLKTTLAFYADPDTYFAIAMIGEHPHGDFLDDMSDVEGTLRPGAMARRALGVE